MKRSRDTKQLNVEVPSELFEWYRARSQHLDLSIRALATAALELYRHQHERPTEVREPTAATEAVTEGRLAKLEAEVERLTAVRDR